MSKQLPKGRIFVSCSSSSDNVAKARNGLIESHNFARRIRVIGPAQPLVLDHNPHVYHLTCNLTKLISGLFLDTWIKQNTCTVLSDGSIDHETVIGMVDGQLYITLDKEMYQRAGLQGKRSKTKHRWVVSYDMRSVGFMPGNKGYDRLLWSLANTPLGTARKFSVVLGKGVKLNNDLEAIFTECNLSCQSITQDTQNLDNVIQPSFAVPSEYKDEWAGNTLEWLGLVALKSPVVQNGDQTDPYLCSYEVMDPLPSPTNLCITTWDGPMSRQFVEYLLGKLDASWFALHVDGNDHAPVAWRDKEHIFTTTGENAYTILAADKYNVQFKQVCAGDL